MSVFAKAPFLVLWETTRACALACVHCRADALARRDPGELTTDEGRQLLDRVAAFGSPPPLMVLTGGDPLRRPDIANLVAHGARAGLSMSLTPSATGAATAARLEALASAGLARLAVSLDGPDAASHDAFRGVRGSHRHTLALMEHARALRLPLQINTTVCRETRSGLAALARQLESVDIALWALFFLVPVGRADVREALDAAAIEGVLEWLADLAGRAPFGIKTTEAPQFHRVLAARAGRGERLPDEAAAEGRPAKRGVSRAGRAVTDGNGVVFVDHVGRICPSGFLPLTRGDVRRDDLVAVYRDDALFQGLRDPERLEGRCGVCEHRERCGGSRARAFAATGNPFSEDPGCAWHPGAGTPGGAATVGQDPREAAVHAALGTVIDPELGASIVDLGLVRGIRLAGARAEVSMTLTAPGCPLRDVLREWAQRVVLAVPGIAEVEVALDLESPALPRQVRGEASHLRKVSLAGD